MSKEMGGGNAKISLQPSNEAADHADMQNAVAEFVFSDEEVESTAERLGHAKTPDEPADNQYFFEDEVFMIDRKGRARFGLVIETSDSFSDEEEEEYEEMLQKGQVRVAWYPDGRENIYSDRDLGLIDRTLMPGDVVKRFLPGSNHPQHGYCRNITMKTDVKVLGTKYIIRNVDVSRLRFINLFQRDHAVCMDSWVGSIKEVEEKAVLRLPSGCRLEVSSSDFYCFKDPKTRYMQGIYNPQIFYPGNVITGRLPSMENIKVLTPNIPCHRNRKGKISSKKFIVEDIYTDSVWVQWQCKALCDEPNTPACALQNPESFINGEELKRLKRLNLFEPCMLQINDRCFLNYQESDKLITKAQWDQEQTAKYKRVFKEQHGEKKLVPLKNYDSNKLKKKLSTTEADKSSKSKKILVKVEKSINSKDRSDSTENFFEQLLSGKFRSTNEDTGWVSEEGDPSDNSGESLIEVEAAASSTTSTGSSSSSRCSPRRISDRKRKVRPLKKKCCKVASGELNPRVGERLVTEALLVYSMATVVWQDGSIEDNIPSTQLYPLHHLDNHEFFPGDFVVMRKDEADAMNFRDYGVIQTVDHEDRISRVKWFTTYISADDPQPTYKCETEVSVYDLKDHPDFQYRPGTMVIRVANFEGEDANCTAGQVVDNFTDGRVRVWWVDGHTSMCWPQDLFEVGQHDHVDLNQESDSESWETESDDSAISSRSITTESETLLNIETAREAIARLEEIFRISPSLQSREVMRKLINIFSVCRCFDRLLSTHFFDTKNFSGLIEDMWHPSNAELCLEHRNRSHTKAAQKPASKIQAIISVNSSQKLQSPHSSGAPESNAASKEYAPKVLINITGHSHKSFPSTSSMTVFGSNNTGRKSSSVAAPTGENYDEKVSMQTKSLNNIPQPQSTNLPPERTHKKIRCSSVPPAISQESQNSYNSQKIELLSSAILSIEKAFAHTSLMNWADPKIDSCTDCKNKVPTPKTTQSYGSLPDETVLPELMCVRLCGFLKVQLRNCFEEISHKFYKKRQSKYKSKTKDETNVEEEQLEHCSGEANVLTPSLTSIGATESCSEILSSTTSTETSDVDSEYFQMISNAPKTHKFYSTVIEPANPHSYVKSIQREHCMLQGSLPPGAWVRVFEDRMDLMSVMLLGPKNTPYEDGMFLFDLQMGRDYPKSPPTCHYISFCTDRLNPNLYEEGKVCVSLLGTWSGRDTEVWGPNSTILQVIVSIQGLILVPEPYFNEAGYEKQKGSQLGRENSRMYNEMAIIKMVQATTKLFENPGELFRREIVRHFKQRGQPMYERIKQWMEMSTKEPGAGDQDIDLEKGTAPEFPLLPASKGFCLTLSNILCTFKSKLDVLMGAALPEGLIIERIH